MQGSIFGFLSQQVRPYLPLGANYPTDCKQLRQARILFIAGLTSHSPQIATKYKHKTTGDKYVRDNKVLRKTE